ncbi:Ribosomal RNA large subunit methyltransferase E [Rhizoctonia solani]|uniref:rRNA methyltransferase 2, mitochondrial n=1 Tax=Rhizoctonia solani TaxID=456999 RepID=A0A0K6FYB1_9AGAM|nr:Ribosomal RNA large subunit methyltransferase E [Rhizoctonia solani]
MILRFRPPQALGLNVSGPRYKSTKSSTNWLARQAKDPFVKQRSGAGPDGTAYRARSAFKLIEIDKKFRILYPGQVVCDLGAAPGGWTQVAAQRLKLLPKTEPEEAISTSVGNQRARNLSKLIAVDLLSIDPIPQVHILRGDFTSPSTQARVSELVGDRGVDVVLSDMCANLSGNTIKDTESSLELCEMAFGFAVKHMKVDESQSRNSGVLVMKYFEHPTLLDFMREKLKPTFSHVKTLRLEASRSESREGYFLCTGFRGPEADL